MYALILPMERKARTNGHLSEYARMEYGNEDAGWLVAEANRRSGRPRRKATLARRIRTAFSGRPAITGLPRVAEDCPARA